MTAPVSLFRTGKQFSGKRLPPAAVVSGFPRLLHPPPQGGAVFFDDHGEGSQCKFFRTGIRKFHPSPALSPPADLAVGKHAL